ncbi:ArsR/SmtB family transcription factor [Saccharopolyspora kobensis]|uniref:ArsR/SmtB family transcription factor n=1 Tax=Saccharopolyspora kobensis TaxID=146035 RepID=UPI001161096D|nr:metalloregulator ArsR/SmtB family transcription factor [Saccharopolyspora kobensis]
MGNDDLTRAAALFRAMGHPIRLGMLERLRREGEICACDFTDHFGVSQPTISGHLRTLRDAGLVRTRRDGTQICYSLAPDGLEVVRRMSDALCTAE